MLSILKEVNIYWAAVEGKVYWTSLVLNTPRLLAE